MLIMTQVSYSGCMGVLVFLHSQGQGFDFTAWQIHCFFQKKTQRIFLCRCLFPAPLAYF